MQRPLTIFVLAFLLAAPVFAHASTRASFFGPIVPLVCHCDKQPVVGSSELVTTAPDYGCVLQVIQNLINFGISIGILVVTFYIAIAGFQLIVSQGNSGKLTKAKAGIQNALIGILVILSAWLIVDFVMKTLYDTKSYGPWNAILADNGNHACLVARTPQDISVATVGADITSVGAGESSTVPGGVGGDVTSKVCNASAAYRGSSTKAGPSNGREACAWAVNNVLRNAGVSAIGSVNVNGMESALKAGRGMAISQSAAQCGDIVIEAGDSHVGICQNSGCSSVLSNSSSHATFSWSSGINFSPSYNSGNGRIYRIVK